MKAIALRLRDGWKRVMTTRHTRALQEEVARLRSENRALLNSILGVAGIPPIVVHGEHEGAGTTGALEWTGERAQAQQSGAKRTGFAEQVAAPLRHRSWQQIYRALEFESAKRKQAGTPERTAKASAVPTPGR